MAKAKKFHVKVLYDSKNERLVAYQDIRENGTGRIVGTTILIADPDRVLPKMQEPRPEIVERMAVIEVSPSIHKVRGEQTILKRRG